MNARLQGAVLALLGATLGRLAWGVSLAHYVRPGTRPLVLAAATALCVAGVVSGVGGPVGSDGAPPPDRARGRGPGRVRGQAPRGANGQSLGWARGHRPDRAASRAAWLLLLPTLTIAVVAPPALGVLTASRPPVAPPRPSAGFAALPPSGPVTIRLSDVVLRTVWHAGATLRGRTLLVTGFVARSRPHGFVLARLVITCCAADARPYDIAVTAPGRAPAVGQWVTVSGRYLGASPAGPVVPALRAINVAAVPEPTDPYG